MFTCIQTTNLLRALHYVKMTDYELFSFKLNLKKQTWLDYNFKGINDDINW